MAITIIKNGYVLSVVLLLIPIGSASAETRVLLMAEANVSVFEAAPDERRTETTEHVLSAGIGRGQREGQLISYLRFDLSAIPNSTLFNRVMVDSSQLRLLALAPGLANRDVRFLANIGSCTDSTWVESEMTWNSRVCIDGLEGEDSVIIDGHGLPQAYTWDVTRGIAQAKEKGDNNITFVVMAHRLLDCPRDPLEGKGCDEVKRVEFVRFASRERVQFGVSAVPTLVVSHSSHPTALMNFLNSMLAVLSAIGVTAGIYEVMRKTRSRGIG